MHWVTVPSITILLARCHPRAIITGRTICTNQFILNKQRPDNWNHKKKALYVSNFVKKLAKDGDPAAKQLEPLRLAVKEQGDIVRSLKESWAPDDDVKKAVTELMAKKKILEDMEMSLAPKNLGVERTKLDDLLKKRFFYDTSFSIYGGISGQYDLGPMGCGMKTNLINMWRNHFILEEQLLEVDCTILTPEPVFKASGHLDRFTDLMVKDTVTGECFRLDHLIKGFFDKNTTKKGVTDVEKNEMEDIVTQLDGMSKEQMGNIVTKYQITSPTTGNPLSDPMEFNLMFQTSIGPSGDLKAYLRPETAQGIFVNFKRLLDFNQGQLPFGCAQVGTSFRNEISPRSGLIRTREFTMAEIEYFLDPSNKDHPKFGDIQDHVLTLYSSDAQMSGESVFEMTIGEAVDKKIIANQTIGYFMARIHSFLLKIGVDGHRLRFRQHMPNEMAHYACDCWDAESLTSNGWLECVGCADRSAYDLTQHSEATGIKLTAEKPLKEPKEMRVKTVLPNRSAIRKELKGDSDNVCEAISSLSDLKITEAFEQLATNNEYTIQTRDGKSFALDMNKFILKDEMKMIHVEEFTPSVIEPSFGVGRLMHTVWEHSFRSRDFNEDRTYLSLPPMMCPIKVSILPLSSKEQFITIINQLRSLLIRDGLPHKVDYNGSVGRRYVRTDEIGIPFGVTIDFDSISKEPVTVTLRERDTRQQVRIPVIEVVAVVKDLTNGVITWTDVTSKYPIFTEQENK